MAKRKTGPAPGRQAGQVDKRIDRKRELADHAITTLAELGYANTSLRDIAGQSGVSVGVLHYYFEDKVELISYCVRQYKEDFIARVDESILAAPSRDSAIAAFIHDLVDTVERSANMHRLWYDIRTQALFDENFRPVADEIEQALINLVERVLAKLQISGINPLTAYVTFDGLFLYHLRRRLVGDATALPMLREALMDAFTSMGAPGMLQSPR